MRLGVLTGGGDCPGLNAVIRGIVKTCHFEYGHKQLEIVGILDGFRGLVENQSIPLNLNTVSGILPRGGTILGASNRDNPFAYPVSDGQGGFRKEDRTQVVLENYRRWRLDALIVIGGDGSLTIGNQLQQHGINVVGVPKTIDNDLSGTDQTFGFDTAVTTVCDALDKLHTTADSHHRVMVVEVMGRHAGWIAIHSGLSGGADAVLIPEIPFELEPVCEKVMQRKQIGKYFSIIVVAEGAYFKGGELVIQRIVPGSFEPRRLGGIGQLVGARIEEMTGIETRVTVLGHVQRGGSPTPFDRLLGTRFGSEAVHQAMRGNFGCMVSLKTPDITTVPLEAAIAQRLVDPRGPLARTARSVGISLGERDEAGRQA